MPGGVCPMGVDQNVGVDRVHVSPADKSRPQRVPTGLQQRRDVGPHPGTGASSTETTCRAGGRQVPAGARPRQRRGAFDQSGAPVVLPGPTNHPQSQSSSSYGFPYCTVWLTVSAREVLPRLMHIAIVKGDRSDVPERPGEPGWGGAYPNDTAKARAYSERPERPEPGVGPRRSEKWWPGVS